MMNDNIADTCNTHISVMASNIDSNNCILVVEIAYLAIQHHGKLQRSFRIFRAMNRTLDDSLQKNKVSFTIAFNKVAEQS